jgi:iron complex outermembrane receptor protein
MMTFGGIMFKQLKSRIPCQRFLASSIVVTVICGAAVFAPATSALAQESAMLEEIVVTSRRYEESLQDAPVAVAVMSEEFIQQNRIDKADDIFNYTPGATWESFSKMQPVASMRGVIAPTPGNASSESSIQTVMDNIVISKDFMKSPPMYDLDRVEVLRGPQGTSFGRNASVGLIHFVTHRPTQESSTSIQGTVGSDERFEVKGHFNRAVSDTTAFRLAFNHTQEDGEMESISTGDGLNGEENTAIRASMLFEPSEKFSAYVKLEYSEDRDEAPVRHGYQQPDGSDCSIPYVNSPPYQETYFDDCSDVFRVEISPSVVPGFDPVDFHTDRDILTFAAELVWNLNNDLTLTSITGYMDGETDSLMDLVGTPNDVSWQLVRNDGDMFSTELRLDNIAQGGAFRWLAGVYFLQDEESRQEQNLFQQRDARGGPFVPTTRETGGSNKTDSWSVFAEFSWDVSERGTLTYGGRFVNDDKDYDTGARGWGVDRQLVGLPGVSTPFEDGSPQLCDNVGPPEVCGSEANPAFFNNNVSDSWDDFISKISYDVEINDNLNFYALFSQGFKSGTFQPDALNSAQALVVVEPETSENWELGFKGAGERYRYALTGFFLKVDDVQTINLVPAGGSFVGLISNVGSVETIGLEVEGAFLVSDNFLFTANAASFDAEMRDTNDPSDPTIDISGQRPAGAPKWTYNLIGEYTVPMASGAALVLRADYRGRSDVFNQTSSRLTSPPLRLRPQINDWGARVTWISASEQLRLSIWGKNLREDYDIANFGPPSPCCSTFAAAFRGKRQFGLTATYDF